MSIAGLREKLDDNRPAVMIGAGVLIVLSLIWLVVRLSGGGAPTLPTQATAVYFDLDQQTIRLIEHDTSTGPPASPMAGTDNVFIASVWYCGDAQGVSLTDGMTLAALEDAGLFIAWLERDDPDTPANAYVTNPILMRTLENPVWQKGESPAGLAIIESPLDRCEDAAQYVPK